MLHDEDAFFNHLDLNSFNLQREVAALKDDRDLSLYQEVSTEVLAKEAHYVFIDGTKNVEGLEKFVNRSANLMRYSDTRYHNGGNRMLLMDDPTNARYYLSRTELQAAQVYNIDYDHLRGRNIFGGL